MLSTEENKVVNYVLINIRFKFRFKFEVWDKEFDTEFKNNKVVIFLQL